MALILKLDLDMVTLYLHTKNEVSMSRSSKVIHKQTDRHDQKHYLTAYAGGSYNDYSTLFYRNEVVECHVNQEENFAGYFNGRYNEEENEDRH